MSDSNPRPPSSKDAAGGGGKDKPLPADNIDTKAVMDGSSGSSSTPGPSDNSKPASPKQPSENPGRQDASRPDEPKNSSDKNPASTSDKSPKSDSNKEPEEDSKNKSGKQSGKKSGKQSGTSRDWTASRSERLGGRLVGTNPTPASNVKMIEQFGAQKTRLRQNLDFLTVL